MKKFSHREYKRSIPVKLDDVLKDWPWPYLRNNLGGTAEYECPHGIGHGGIHGCDGCCHHESFERITSENKRRLKNGSTVRHRM